MGFQRVQRRLRREEGEGEGEGGRNDDEFELRCVGESPALGGRLEWRAWAIERFSVPFLKNLLRLLWEDEGEEDRESDMGEQEKG